MILSSSSQHTLTTIVTVTSRVSFCFTRAVKVASSVDKSQQLVNIINSPQVDEKWTGKDHSRVLPGYLRVCAETALPAVQTGVAATRPGALSKTSQA